VCLQNRWPDPEILNPETQKVLMFPMSMLSKKLVSFLTMTALLAAMGGCRGLNVSSNPPPGAGGPLPETQSPVKRVIVIIMQNRSFDNLFGTFPGANGIQPGVAGFNQTTSDGTQVSPHELTSADTSDLLHGRDDYITMWNNGAMNRFAFVNGELAMGYYDDSTDGVDELWSWASQYALADNYFAAVMSNAPANPLYLVAAADNNFVFSVKPAFGPCNDPDPNAQPYTFQNVGDQMNSNNVAWGWYHERYGECSDYVEQQNPFQYFQSTQNSANLMSLESFDAQLADGNLPPVAFVQPAPSHTGHPGSGSVTAAFKWLDGFIKDIQNSSIWPETAIVVVWDESGGWWDHVAPAQIDSQGRGPRVPMMVISPHAKQGHISHVAMDQVSILRWIQWNWGLGRLNARNNHGGDTIELNDMFNF
jgi:phospholipase C